MAERYQREIEEILENVNEEPPSDVGTKRGATRQREPRQEVSATPERPSRLGFEYTPGRMLLTGVLLIVLAGVLAVVGIGFAAPLVWVGIGLFILAYVMFFTKPRRTMERRWRGSVTGTFTSSGSRSDP